ncbi:hypothetical protein ES703_125888 [subsurface metagenome]
MKLGEAIEILQHTNYLDPNLETPDILEALMLGIQAMKWRLLMENDYGSWCGPPLLGETKD